MRLQLNSILKLSSNDSSQTVIPIKITSTSVKTFSTITPSTATISSKTSPCTNCRKQDKMASKGAFMAYKARDNMNSGGQSTGSSWGSSEQKQQSSFFQSTMKISSSKSDNPPAKYNEKMMMSIWGLYNRYSVHNIKSHNTYENTQ